MAEEKALTQADIDKAVKDAVAAAKTELQEGFDAETQGLKDKNRELLGKLREASGVKPEDLQAAEADRDKALADLAEAQKQVKALTTERDKAVKSLENEQAAARSYALEAELSGAISEGNVVPSLAPAFRAMMAQQARAELVDGKYAVTVGDKPAREAIKAFLDSDDGKAFRAAPINGGGGAPGSQGSQGGGKTATRAEFDAMPAAAKVEFGKEGGKVVDQAA